MNLKRITAPSHRDILALAIPIILANSATPLLGLTDIAVVGHFGSVSDLGAIALGNLLFSFLFWGFGFLRMSTSGFVAQAAGRQDVEEAVAVVVRALLLGVVIGCVLIALQWPLITAALWILGGDASVEQVTRDYFFVRIWSAPATLALYAVNGLLIGRGLGRQLLRQQLLLNGLNLLLNIFFAGVLGWGARGIAAGTALAEWLTLLISGTLIWFSTGDAVKAAWHRIRPELFVMSRMRALMAANGDILIRTMTLLGGISLFTDQGARFGADTLAANHILLQFTMFSAFFLDGFAFVAESLAGRAFGAGDRQLFAIVVRRSSQLAAATAAVLALIFLFSGEFFITHLTAMPQVRALAIQYLPFCAAYVFVSFVAFQLDGIFIGTTQTRVLRNAALIATGLYVLLCFPLARWFGNAGLWSAFIVFVALRAITLLVNYRRVFS
jgi:MATE family multidrug resistance protein